MTPFERVRQIAPADRSPVKAEFYDRLLEEIRDFGGEGEPVDADTERACARLLHREARMLDESRFEDWLELFASDGLYWIPHVAGGGDPRREVSIAFDDVRRLGDRVTRLRTGCAWSQVPPSRTCHQITNVEAWRGRRPGTIRVRSTFVVHESRGAVERALPGWCAHVLRLEDTTWRIVVKQVNLLAGDGGLENMSLVL